jgi:hypothetical protein
MDGSAVVMLLIGGIFLWGGLVLAIVNYRRVSARDTGD